ncbi:protein FAM185A-like [Littorina saxatilis]|uniref:DUF4097 domain-containing protein n=1 Tax=Littorina saxatilis TaxID=31220 RepID=A0AAN9BC15_9CAEN
MGTFVKKVIQLGGKHHACKRLCLSDPKILRMFSTTTCNTYRAIVKTSPRLTAQVHCCAQNLIALTCRQSLHGSTQPSSPTADDLNTENLISAWFNEVKTFGTLHMHNVPFDVHIQPLNPVDYPDHNKSIVKVFYNGASSHGTQESPVGRKLSELGKLCDMKVKAEDDGGKVSVTCDVPSGVQLPLLCVIKVPVKFDVDFKGSHDGSVTIGSLDCGSIKVHMERGDCHLSSIRTTSITIECDEGNISSNKQLLGAIHLQCGKNGSITGERFQGGSIQCTTEAGDIDVKTIYAEKTTCSSHSGNVHVRDCHGDVTVKTSDGNLTVDSLDGKLSAELENGSADVFVTRQEGVTIATRQGDVMLRFAEDNSCSLDLEAKVIEKDESLKVVLDKQGKGFIKSETDTVVKASAPQGKISLRVQDWLSSIKLQFGNTTS